MTYLAHNKLSKNGSFTTCFNKHVGLFVIFLMSEKSGGRIISTGIIADPSKIYS
jgi:hypothetical protein